MRIRLTLALAATALAGAFVAPATATAAPTGPQPIIGGNVVASAPWAAAVFQNGAFACSGSIIAPRWVLTAAHCLRGTVSVRVGSVHRSSGGTTATVSAIHTRHDLALLHLGTSVATTYVALADTNPPVGAVNDIYGWGRTCMTCEPSPQLKTATVRVTAISGEDSDGGPVIRSAKGNGVSWQGDSGGPQFHNGRQVGVSFNGNGTTSQNYSSVIASRGWITEISGV
ncbi:S1 family peptidase [Micromonospora sp. SH-82]|uniref:S1 family peptidase n=1 Tax=Micromonospora sp. SH-82 TaxID=3132938 RepID=UPI003EC00FCB